MLRVITETVTLPAADSVAAGCDAGDAVDGTAPSPTTSPRRAPRACGMRSPRAGVDGTLAVPGRPQGEAGTRRSLVELVETTAAEAGTRRPLVEPVETTQRGAPARRSLVEPVETTAA